MRIRSGTASRAEELLARAKDADGEERDGLRQLAVFECLAVLEFPRFIPAKAKGALPENEAQISKARRGPLVKQLAKAVGMVMRMAEEGEPGRKTDPGTPSPSRSAGTTPQPIAEEEGKNAKPDEGPLVVPPSGGQREKEAQEPEERNESGRLKPELQTRGRRGEEDGLPSTRLRPGKPELPTQRAIVLNSWVMGTAAARTGEFGRGRSVMHSLRTRSGATPIAVALARYGAGLLCAREGLYPEAIEEFELAGREQVFRLSAQFQKAMAQFRQGEYGEAAEAFGQIVGQVSGVRFQANRRPQIPEFRYRLAQCHEFMGDFAKVRELYQQIADSDRPDETLHGLCQAALSRLKRASTRSSSAMAHHPSNIPHSPCSYIGENRSDRGRWHLNHGTEAFVLCGVLSPQDIVGRGGRRAVPSGVLELREEKSSRGASAPREETGHGVRPGSPQGAAGPRESVGGAVLGYRFRTGREGERGRRWLSRLDDAGGPDLALWNPVTSTWSTGNWDDYGEQLPPGPGDLIVSLTVPEGAWRLSLAFVNDHNYYESSRRYTIHIRDGAGRFLTGCDVEDFITPLYKHFAVKGPIRLVVHIHRDQSINTILSGIFLDPFPAACPIPDEVEEALATLKEEWEKDPKRHPERKQDPFPMGVHADLIEHFDELMSGCEALSPRDLEPSSTSTSTRTSPSTTSTSSGQAGSGQATNTSASTRTWTSTIGGLRDARVMLTELDRLLTEFHRDIAALPAWMGAYAGLRLFELEFALSRSADRQQAALKLFCSFVRSKESSGQTDFLLRALARSIAEARLPNGTLRAAASPRSPEGLRYPYMAAEQIVDRCRAELALESDWKAVFHKIGPMARAYYPWDRAFAVELFRNYVRALVRKRSRKEQSAALMGLLGEEVREGRWAFAEVLVPRVRRLFPQRTQWPPGLSDLIARTYSGLQQYEAAAVEGEQAIKELEARLLDEVPDKETEGQLADRYFLLVCQYAASGELPEAEQALERARPYLKDAARLANAHYLIATGHLRQGATARAAPHLRVIVRSYPKTHWAGLALRRLEQSPGARPTDFQ